MQTRTTRDEDAALACLQQLATATGELHRKVTHFTESMRARDWAPDGLPYRQLVPLRKRLEIVEQISEVIREITTTGHLFRRMQARALYAEGLTMAQLASVFGVSRQRVSVLLRDPVAGPSKDEDAVAS
jgi:predicted XRE-type DNA-binding protein